MARITNDFERVKVRVLGSVCWSQGRDAIEFGFDEEAKFNHQAEVLKVELNQLGAAAIISDWCDFTYARDRRQPRGKKETSGIQPGPGLSFRSLMDWAVISLCLFRRRYS